MWKIQDSRWDSNLNENIICYFSSDKEDNIITQFIFIFIL